MITSGTGDLVQNIQYVPFGEVFVEERNASWCTPYKFNGKEQDEETGLCYYGARYYDPRTSVWLSVDPLAERYPNISSYVYCYNSPVNYIDPDGRYSEKWISDISRSVYKFFHPNQKNIGESIKNKYGQWGFSRPNESVGGGYVQYGLGGYKGYYGEHTYGNGHSQEQILRKSGNQGPSIDANDFASEGFGVVIGWIKSIFSKKQPEYLQPSSSSKENQNEELEKKIDENLKAEQPLFNVTYQRITYDINKEGDTTSTWRGLRESYSITKDSLKKIQTNKNNDNVKYEQKNK